MNNILKIIFGLMVVVYLYGNYDRKQISNNAISVATERLEEIKVNGGCGEFPIQYIAKINRKYFKVESVSPEILRVCKRQAIL